MALLVKKHIEIDACPACKGIWFDEDELNKITSSDISIEGLIYTGKSLGRNIPCPQCTKLMKYVNVKGVTVDICQDCLGIWLDAGELAAIGSVLENMEKEKGALRYEIQEEKAEGFFSKIQSIFHK